MQTDRRPRTKLEQVVWERRQTYEEFSADAERFAREHGINATLGPRHVKRLASGQRGAGEPLGPVRVVTRRLLEEMLGLSADELLAPPPSEPAREPSDQESELRARLAAARSVDRTLVSAFRDQMNLSRIVDRRLGAPALVDELGNRISQISLAMNYSLRPGIRAELAEVLVDACCLAGWLSLDIGATDHSWNFYHQARLAALDCESPGLFAYACAGQATVLLDIGETSSALELATCARESVRQSAPRILKAWVAGAYGEAGAANGLATLSLESFNEAARLIQNADGSEAPYLVFDEVHLTRWRGGALSCLGDPEAVGILTSTLDRLDRSFTRAEVSLRADLAQVLLKVNDRETALPHIHNGAALARQIGSVRQRRRLERLNGGARPASA